MENVIYDLWLSLKLSAGSKDCRTLVEKFSSSKEIYNKSSFFDIDISPALKKLLEDKDLTRAQEEFKFCEEEKVFVVSYWDSIYPELLKEIYNPPLVLYCKGNVNLLKRPLLSVAGSRKCSNEGKVNTQRFIKTAENFGIVPVCAFSKGIEAEVCRCADQVIIIIPCGINKTYPARHFALKNSLLKGGGLIITEQPFEMDALPHNIVLRNRLIAGISPYTFIVEAGENSGTNIIFNNCNEICRACFTIPGSIYSPYYVGNNIFLKKGAIAVTEPQDIINFYQILYPEKITEADNTETEIKSDIKSDFENINEEERMVIEAIGSENISYDSIIEKTSLPPSKLAAVLTMLEMEQIIENKGGIFSVKKKG